MQQAASLYALIDQDRDAFLAALDRLLDAHAAEAANPEAAHEPRRLICLPALTLARLAIDAGLVTSEQLPVSIYIPLEVLA
jgi:anti-sigma factor RsiW